MAKKGKKPSEVFISHSNRDRAFVTRLVAILRKNKIPFWYSPKHIIGAAQWHDEIGKALARCDWFVVILTPRSVNSRWVKRELLYALNSARYEDRIVPILVRDCALQRWVPHPCGFCKGGAFLLFFSNFELLISSFYSVGLSGKVLAPVREEARGGCGRGGDRRRNRGDLR